MDLATLRDISLLWLILLGLIGVLPVGVLFFYAIRGMIRLRQLAKQYLPIGQEKARLLADTTETVSQKVTSPLIAMEARAAQTAGITRGVFSRRNNA
jgi:hypothetical protein